MATAQDKQQALCAAIGAQVKVEMAPEFARVHVTLGSIVARIDVLEQNQQQLMAAKGSTVKRAVTTKAAAAAAGGDPAAAGGDDDAYLKVKNTLLWFRYKCAHNIDGFRDEYINDAAIAAAAAADVLKNQNLEKDPAKYYSAVAAHYWKVSLTEAQKKEMKSVFDDWKKGLTAAAAEPPLEPEADSELMAEGDPMAA